MHGWPRLQRGRETLRVSAGGRGSWDAPCKHFFGVEVLHMGDMSFKEGSDGSLIEDEVLTKKICELLQVSLESFTMTFQCRLGARLDGS